VHSAYYDSGARDVGCDPLEFAKTLKDMMPFASNVEEITRALGYKNFAFFLKAVILPRHCETKRLVGPKGKLKSQNDRLVASPGPELTALLQTKKIPVILSLCASKQGKSDCGPHALVAYGTRKSCCGTTCKEQIRIWDSSEAFKGERDRDGWVDLKIVEERLSRYQKHLKSLGASTELFTWLESR
jgi:hypothetical protein